MSLHFVLTLTGTDRVGLVDEVTRTILNLGGNIETSRMSRLGGEFAILMLVTLPSEQGAALDRTISGLSARGYKATIAPTGQESARARAGWQPYRIEVCGADHEGIIHQIAHVLSGRGISIEEMVTGTTPAPDSGAPLFTMEARIVAPPNLDEKDWRRALDEAGRDLHVDVEVSADLPS